MKPVIVKIFLLFMILLPGLGLAKKMKAPEMEAVREPFFLYMGQVKLEDKRKTTKSMPKTIEVQAHRINPLAHYLKSRNIKTQLKDNKLILNLKDLDTMNFRPQTEQPVQKESFVMDYYRIHFVELKRMIEKKYGKRPSPTQLSDFVFNYIANKIGFSGFSPASFIVKYPEGNSADHAVLLTALLRLYNYRAQMVVGVVMKPVAKTYYLLRRGWVLVKIGRRWQRIDPLAQIEKDTQVKVRAYIPEFEVEDESMSFKLSYGHQKDQSIKLGKINY